MKRRGPKDPMGMPMPVSMMPPENVMRTAVSPRQPPAMTPIQGVTQIPGRAVSMVPTVKTVISIEVNPQCQMKPMQVLRVTGPGQGSVPINRIADRRSTGGNRCVNRTRGGMNHSGWGQPDSGIPGEGTTTGGNRSRDSGSGCPPPPLDHIGGGRQIGTPTPCLIQ